MSAAERWRKIYFLTPAFKPVGGIVKIFDYVNHALSCGYEPVICCPQPYEKGLPLFEIPRFAEINPENGIEFTDLTKVSVGPHDLAYFSWPGHYKLLEARMSRWTLHEQIIHIVQNVRHSTPEFTDGYALRLLTRPMTRIMINDVVLEAARPYLNESSLTGVIDLGHETGFFERHRRGGVGSPAKVGYTTWKSDLGDRVAEIAGKDPATGFEFAAIREPVDWGQLRELYHWADVFLATPNVEEGFYMPGLEAMEAGAIVISPDAGGNKAYCDFGSNCLEVNFEDPASYVEALHYLKNQNSGHIESLREEGYKTVGRFTLENERRQFTAFLEKLDDHLREVRLMNSR